MALNKSYFIDLFGQEAALLKNNLGSLESFTVFMQELGWKFDSIPDPFNAIINVIDDIYDLYVQYPDISLEQIEEIPGLISNMTQAIKDLQNEASYFDTYYSDYQAEGFIQDFPEELLEYIICRAIRQASSRLYGLLSFLGIITEETILVSSTVRCNYIRYSIDIDAVGAIISNPRQLINEKYAWESASFDIGKFNFELMKLLMKFNKQVYINSYTNEKIKSFDINYVDSDRLAYDSIKVELFEYYNSITGLSASVPLNILPYINDGVPTLALHLEAYGGLNKVIDIETLPFTISFRGSAGWEGIVLIINPIDAPILANVDSGNGLVNGAFEVSLDWKTNGNGGNILIFGDYGDSNLTAGGLNFSIKIIEDNGADAKVEAGIKEGLLSIENSGDGLLSKVLPSEGLQIKFNLIFGYSLSKGFYIGGDYSGLSYKLPQSISIGKGDQFNLKVDNIIIDLHIEGQTVAITITGDINLQLSVLSLSVKGLGYTGNMTLDKEGNSGNFGPLHFDSSFKMPTGVGISIQSSSVSGGGFLKIDAPNHKYTGGIELKINKLSIAALGILKTKLPSGKDGFSLLMLVKADGFTAIPLGFGFSLTGVGGLLGLNRTADLKALRDGVRTGANQSILFPKDVVKNADKIISDLEACFPDKEGRFLIGPMAKIIWGSPKPLITIDLGLIIEIPAPISLALLGVVKAILPDEENKKLIININFLGTIEFDKKLISFDATIYESKLLTFDISGDMAFRLKWGDQSNFLLTVGGFHPAYTPPPLNLPPLRRLAISLVNKEHLKVGLETYFAITSNTVQVGAKVMAFAEHGKYNAIGLLWLDVLFQFSPFYFIADMGAMVAIRRKEQELLSASLRATLQGPSPWNVRGSVEFKIAKIGFTINFNETFGEKDEQKLEDKLIWPELKSAIEHKDNWQTLLPQRNQLFVSVKEMTSPDALYLHPLGRLALNQTLSPLNFSLQKFGHVKPKDYKKFFIDSVTNMSDQALSFSTLRDKFSPAQFLQLNDQQKLSRPSFEDFESGVSIGTDFLDSAYMVAKSLEYQTPKVIDRRMKVELAGNHYETVEFANAFIGNNAVNKAFSNPVKGGALPYDGPSSAGLNTRQYAVANKSNLSGYDAQRFNSMADAQNYINQIVKNSPAQKGKLIVSEARELV